jgi:hypothetical protein
MLIALMLMITETFMGGFQRPIGQRHVGTAKMKLSGIDSDRL